MAHSEGSATGCGCDVCTAEVAGLRSHAHKS